MGMGDKARMFRDSRMPAAVATCGASKTFRVPSCRARPSGGTDATCGRRYDLIEYDVTKSPWRELRRIHALEVSANGVKWAEAFNRHQS